MDLIQLKMPPDKLAGVIAAIERDLMRDAWDEDTTALQQTLDWMRYRLAKWNAAHPAAAAS